MSNLFKHYETCRYCQSVIMRGKMKKVVRESGNKEPIYFHPHCLKKLKSYIGKEVKLDLFNKLKKMLIP
jgi:hypothetical protein